MPETDTKSGHRHFPAITLLCLLSIPLLGILAGLFFSLYTDLHRIEELTDSINRVYLPSLIDRQGIILNISNLRRLAEVAYASDSHRLRRDASIDAQAIAEDSLFENEPVFTRDAQSIQRLIRHMDTLKTHLKNVRDERAAAEQRLAILLEDFPERRTSSGTETPGMLRELERLCPEGAKGDLCGEVFLNRHFRQTAMEQEELAEADINETWKELDGLLNALREQAFSNEVLLVRNSGDTIREEVGIIRHRVWILSGLTCIAVLFFFFAVYRLFVAPLTLSSLNLRRIRNGQPTTPVLTHIREFQDLLREVPPLSQYVDLLQEQSTALIRENELITRTSLTDALTGIPNRRAFDQDLPLLMAQEAPLGMLMLDVDYFKRYNDSLGHQAGDGCLQAVARIIRQSLLRQDDRVYRYGGEEFAVLLPGASDNAPFIVARRIQQNFRELKLPHPDSPVSPLLTVSIGIARWSPLSPGEDVVSRADRALYAAKDGGRNRMACAEGERLRIIPPGTD